MTVNIQKFDAAVTGNTSTKGGTSKGGSKQVVAVKFSVGGTPTAVVKVQGSWDGSNYWDLVFIEESTAAETKVISVTRTTAGYTAYVISKGWYPFIRLNLSTNTNVTIDEAWLLEGDAIPPFNFAPSVPA